MAVKRDKPELLAPAGDMERLKMAVLYGADAVYLAGTSYGMRAFAGNFSDEELPQAVAFAHSHGVRVHCTINTMPRNDEAARLPEWLEFLQAAGVDAAILADVGVLSLLIHPFFGLFYDHVFQIDWELYAYSVEYVGAFLPLLLLSRYTGRHGTSGGFSKWFFYMFYPLHLLVLGWLRAVL